MRRGKHWPIPHKELLDGAALALKNSERLCVDARVAFDNDRYSTALALSVLALEEYGKGLMLYEANTKITKIDADLWHSKFEKHEIKLDSILRVLDTFPISPELKQQHQEELKFLRNSFQKWKNAKMEAIYLDWDASTGTWYYYNDKPDTQKQEDAKEALELAERWLTIIKGTVGDFAFEKAKTKIESFKSGKAHCICQDCGLVITTLQQYSTHRNINPPHFV